MKSEIQHIAQDEQYRHLLNRVVKRAELLQYRTSIGLNQELIRFYWSIGEDMAVAQWPTVDMEFTPHPVAQLKCMAL